MNKTAKIAAAVLCWTLALACLVCGGVSGAVNAYWIVNEIGEDNDDD